MKRVTIFLFVMGLLAGCHRVESPSLVLPGEVVEVSASFVVASDGDTKGELEAKGLKIPGILVANDAYHGLQAVDGLVFTGPTGTNVNDISLVLIQP
jgi:hypothetical protein